MSQKDRDSSLDRLLKTQSPNFTIAEIETIANQRYWLTGKLTSLNSERDLNFRIDTTDGDQFVIKVANSAENPAIIAMQIAALEHISIVDPELPVPKAFMRLVSENFRALI